MFGALDNDTNTNIYQVLGFSMVYFSSRLHTIQTAQKWHTTRRGICPAGLSPYVPKKDTAWLPVVAPPWPTEL